MKRLTLLLVTLSLALVLAACGDDSDSKNQDKNAEQSGKGEQASQEMPKPDVEDVPDVVAKVNGDKIKKDEFTKTYKGQFQQMAMQAQMTGKEIDQDKMKKQMAESLVGTKLMKQEVNDRNYEASEDEVNKKLDELAKQRGAESADKMIKSLKEQGMKKEEVMDQVKQQVRLDKLIAEESGDLEPTEDEMKEAYKKQKEQQKKMAEKKDKEVDIPSFDKAKSDIKQGLKRQKESEAMQKIVKDLRKDADVTINL